MNPIKQSLSSIVLLLLLISCNDQQNSEIEPDNKTQQQPNKNLEESTPKMEKVSPFLVETHKTDITGNSYYLEQTDNSTKVYLLYSNYRAINDTLLDTSIKIDLTMRVPERLFNPFNGYLTKDNSGILLYKKVEINYNGVKFHKNWQNNKLDSIINCINLSRREKLTQNINEINDFKIDYKTPEPMCSDTHINHITISKEKSSIYFKDLYNVKIFEADLNKDGENEIYLMSFISCASKIRIYQII